MTERGEAYPYGYRPIRQPRVISPAPKQGGGGGGGGLPDRERQRLSARKQNLKSTKSYKVLLIGESGVGKSTLVARLCEDRFLTEIRQYTLGFDMFEKECEIDGERLKMYIWDTVGTENYDSITTQYYRGGAGIIIVYDITALHSFEQLTKWMGYVEMHATADVNLMLLGSKLDLDSRREITFEEGQRFAESHEIELFFEVSAKTGYNVDEAFYAFFREVHRKAQGSTPEQVETSSSEGKKCCF